MNSEATLKGKVLILFTIRLVQIALKLKENTPVNTDICFLCDFVFFPHIDVFYS